MFVCNWYFFMIFFQLTKCKVIAFTSMIAGAIIFYWKFLFDFFSIICYIVTRRELLVWVIVDRRFLTRMTPMKLKKRSL